MLTHFRRFIALIKRQSRKIFASLGLSALIIFLCYLMNNCPYPYWDSLDKFTWMEYFLSNIKPDSTDTSDALFINISHDQQLVNVSYDRNIGNPSPEDPSLENPRFNEKDYTYKSNKPDGSKGASLQGTIAITNRESLLHFLQKAEKANNYKYIFLDIYFEQGINTETDDSLFAQIDKMRNVAYSRHSDIENHEKAPYFKGVINHYFTTRVNTSFTRYQYVQDGNESAPLRIFTEPDSANNKTIKSWGPFYYSDGHLCQNSPFMSIPTEFREAIDKPMNYFDLGPELLHDWKDNNIWVERLKDKVVFVGNYETDVHDTYNGKQPGSYLIYTAYKALCEGKHIVSWKSIGLLFIIYVIICMFIINRTSIWQYIPRIKNSKSKLLLFVLDMLGYTTLLSLLTIVFYVCFKDIYNVFFPSLTFSILSLIISYKNKSA